jgi:transposase
MPPHHSDDYKLTAVKYYLSKNQDMRDVCKIFNCSYKSLSRWVNQYQEKGNVKRKTRKNKNTKITPEIEKFVKQQINKYSTMTLWELSKLVNHTYKVKLTDKSIYNILTKHKITRKRLRNKYYPEKREGQEKQDLEDFYKTLNKYDYNKFSVICVNTCSGVIILVHSNSLLVPFCKGHHIQSEGSNFFSALLKHPLHTVGLCTLMHLLLNSKSGFVNPEISTIG